MPESNYVSKWFGHLFAIRYYSHSTRVKQFCLGNMFSRLLSFSKYFDYLYYTVYSCPCYHLVINSDTRMMDGGFLVLILSVTAMIVKHYQ